MAESTVPSTVNPTLPAKRQEEIRGEGQYLLPPVDIFETKDSLVVVADLPGVDKDGVEVRVKDGLLTIEGRAKTATRGDALYSEFTLRDFYRQFQLDDEVDQEKISGNLKHGVLTVSLPKAEKHKPRQISVNIE